MPQGEPLFFTSNPHEQLGHHTRSCSVVTGNVSASASVNTSAQPAVVPKSLPMQSKFLKKNKKGDNIAMLPSPASATSSTRLLPLAPKSQPAEKKREQIIWLAKVLKAASPCPLVLAPKEVSKTFL